MAIFEYKISRKNEWSNFKSILTYVFVFVFLTPLMFHFRFPEESIVDVIPISMIGFLIFLIPVVILHLKYFSINENLVLIYDDFNRSITIVSKKENTKSNFSLDDIKSVFHYMTGPFGEKRMHWWPWDSYNYSIIYLKDNRKFTITSLMNERLELPIGDKYNVITKFYPYPN
ncbi:hypothetical protein FAZ19_15805 [Sphingobacterium alkalisoli]|uniref:PH domain-containing protein n=1 Tax=Sphingobacterium alkalisoli TaxID=1874115 RepID=A0A4U0GYG9_9SPHI|nr:hypothetical protein [Sphingobacterium alkalisoli]TJY63734.1 hypothetical protein FAZ19_15805 [Sphingobacterium alkalisoli]GGH25219.1 hypothetical protein GCM10011418_33690 [Sphingobacterium alkalisoli]